MRHPFLHFPRDPQALAVEDAYFLGPALFAAPVVRRGVTTRTLYLPPGRYVDLDDHRLLKGGTQVSIPAPVTKLPLLLVEGHVLPMLDARVQTLADATEPTVVDAGDMAGVMDVLVALGPGRSAGLVLADGAQVAVARVAQDTGSTGWTAAGSEAALVDCARCVLADATGDVGRVRLNTAPDGRGSHAVAEVRVDITGGPQRRYRFTVLRLP